MRLSILIPVYNVERYLRRCLDSILSQQVEDIEILLGNDGSKDESASICDEYAKHYSNVTVFHNENMGAGAERNFLIDKAQGEYIWFVDADDYIAEGTISSILTKAENYPDSDMITMTFCMVDAEGRKGELWDVPKSERCLTGKEALQKGLFTGYIWEKLYKRDFLNKHRIRFHEELTNQEDLVFNIWALSKCKQIYQSAVFGYNYFTGNSNSTLRDNRLSTQERNVKNTLLAQKEILGIIAETDDAAIVDAIRKLLNFNAGGLLYAMYVMKYPIALNKQAIIEMKSNNLYPVGNGSNRKGNLFTIFANIEPLYLVVCRIHNLFK